jgi:hypothetical protein
VGWQMYNSDFVGKYTASIICYHYSNTFYSRIYIFSETYLAHRKKRACIQQYKILLAYNGNPNINLNLGFHSKMTIQVGEREVPTLLINAFMEALPPPDIVGTFSFYLLTKVQLVMVLCLVWRPLFCTPWSSFMEGDVKENLSPRGWEL